MSVNSINRSAGQISKKIKPTEEEKKIWYDTIGNRSRTVEKRSDARGLEHVDNQRTKISSTQPLWLMINLLSRLFLPCNQGGM
mgnify:CR=1 FL=1